MSAKGERIQIRFSWKGRDLRPTLNLKPTAANLKHAKRLRETIVEDIRRGEFNIRKYFPDYRLASELQGQAATVTDVMEEFLRWARTRQQHASVVSLRRKLTSFWQPDFGGRDIRKITYRDLSAHVASREW